MAKNSRSFRKPEAQARHAVRQHISLGSPRHENRGDGKIHSVGTARNYTGALAGFTRWIQKHNLGDLRAATKEMATKYLAERSSQVGQSQLDQDRKAIQTHIQEKIMTVKSEIQTTRDDRAVTPDQHREITSRMSEKEAFAADICREAGLRAHEIHSIRKYDERPADQRSGHRSWNDERWKGKEGWERYTAAGKGGLCREFRLSPETAARLEERRLLDPQRVTDRGVNYDRAYDLPGGNALSAAFTRASTDALGESRGLHGERHAFARAEFERHQRNGATWEDALRWTSQELGHFRPDITRRYLNL